jgi:glycosyl hydrolase family 106( putative alpha-L-rhamnosidase)
VLGFLLALALAGETPVAHVARQFQKPPDDTRIMMRWWWFGPSVTTVQIEAEMRRMKEGGIGGFEVAVVYPMAVDGNESYLSPGFLEKVRFTAQKARELGLRMDVTVGSGWSYGGPYITPELASARLRSDRREIEPGLQSLARPAPFENDRLVAAFVGKGSLAEVDPRTFRPLDIEGDGRIPLPPGEGPRLVLFYYASHSGQIVKRAAVGAEGYVLDHYARPAIEKHLREAGDKLLAAAGPGGVYAIFCDSLEVYGGDWTADMFAEFRTRRGYDLKPLLPALDYETGERTQTVRRDYAKTLSELYEERFLVPLKEWTAKNKVLLRIQNYGEPPATVGSSRHADLIDGEGWQFRTLTSSRWASSASHLFGRPVTTSETWTWLHSPAFRATPLDVKAEADQHFLSGINQLIGHGWPYSPPEAGNPGWPFYAAAVLTDKNPWWPAMPDLAAYLQRLSFLLRQGEPVADVAPYVPTDDAWASFRPGGLNLFRRIVELVGPTVVPAILDAGHGFDVFDDATLAEVEARRYKAIVLPKLRLMPDATRRFLDAFEQKGGVVIDAEADLVSRLAAAVPSDVALEPAAPEIGFVHRRLADADVYFLANTGNAARSVKARFRSATPHVESWDPLTGTATGLPAVQPLALEFEPYATRVVVFRRTAGVAAPLVARAAAASEELATGWRVSYRGGGSTATTDLPHSWGEDQVQRFFSGTASYRRSVRPGAAFRAKGTRVFLDFGPARPIEREPLPSGTLRGNSFQALVAPPLREAATVFVNGRRAGAVWAAPYRVDVTALLKDGDNEIRVDVYNTAINRLAEGGRLPDMAALQDRWGQRARLQDLDGLKPLPSGILAVPRLVAER